MHRAPVGAGRATQRYEVTRSIACHDDGVYDNAHVTKKANLKLALSHHYWTDCS